MMDPVQAYRKDGFAVWRGVLDKSEVDAACVELARLWSHALENLDAPWVHWRDHEGGTRVPDRIDPASARSDFFRSITSGDRLKGLGAQLLGGPVRYFKDKLITKEPGVRGYGVHQDFPYWRDLGLAPDDFVTCVLAFDPMTERNGGVTLFPGYHEALLPAHPEITFDVDPAALKDAQAITPDLAPGDVLAFHALTPHCSGPNRGAVARRSLFVTYVPEGKGGEYADYSEDQLAARGTTLGRKV